MHSSSTSMQLLTIRGSHYCERARWALDLAGIPYTEQSSPPMLHFMSTLSARPRGSKAHSVPMLLTPDAGVLTDSADIVRYAANNGDEASGLYPQDPRLKAEVDAIEKLCAEKLGRWTRVILYQELFKSNAATYEALTQGVPAWQRRLLWSFFWPIKGFLRKGMSINADMASSCLNKVRGLFDELGDKLQGGKRRYLVGDTFTAADLTFASLAALVLLPEQYGGGPSVIDLTGVRQVFDTGLLEELRGTAAGRHALEMYRLHRPQAQAKQQAPAKL